MMPSTATAPATRVVVPAPKRRRRRANPTAAILLILLAVLMLAPFIWTALSVTKPVDVAQLLSLMRVWLSQ